MIHFIYLGNLHIEKGPLVLLEACGLLQQRGIPFLCHIVGAPTTELSLSELKQHIEQKKLNSSVIIHGALYGAEKEQLLQQCDAMAFPSFYQNECLPLVLLEGMKHSLALISTTEGAIPDIIEDEVTGFLIAKNDARALADTMQKLAENPTLATEMGVAGHKRYLSEYSEEAFINRISDILRNA